MSVQTRHLLRSSAIALLIAVGSNAGQAATSPVLALPGLDTTDAPIIQHLPASHDGLVFRGEASARHFRVYLPRGELDAVRSFQLAFKNTVAALPDRSTIALAINGHALATLPARSSNALSTVPVAIPPGVLVPGMNAVDISVDMTHRVDCSIAATYELWTLLDPAKTGFVLPASAVSLHTLDDLAGEPLAEDGTTRIHLRLANSADTDTIRQAASFVDALVAREGLRRPVVDVGPESGKGAGFDLILTRGNIDETLNAMSVLAREDGVTLARDPATGRLAVMVAAVDDADLDHQVQAFASKAISLKSAEEGPNTIKGETRRSFANLGEQGDSFAGRHYAKTIAISLPSDFYPANYDKARLLIDGAYAADLEPDSNLVFRVNGTLVSSLRLGPDRGGLLQHEIVELPLRFFHPGPNAIGIEGATRTLADRQCDPTATSTEIRLTIADTSELEFPHFAHLGTTPQLPGALANFQALPGGAPLNVYLADADPASIGAALTILANMASADRAMPMPAIRVGSPSGLDTPGIVVSPLGTLPATLADPVRARLVIADTTNTGKDGRRSPLPVQRPAGRDLWTEIVQGRLDLHDAVGQARRVLRNQGFFFGTDSGGETVPFKPGSLVVAAIDPRLDTSKIAGIEMPKFTSDPAQWLVVTAASDDVLQRGITRLISDGQWNDLRGQVVSLDVDKGRLAAVQPPRVLYVVPKTFAVSDLRPILGGIVSNNIELSLAVLMVLMALLGISTHVLIRRAGAK